MLTTKPLFVVVTLLALISLNDPRALAQSCPNAETYGAERPSAKAVGETRRVRVTGTYFRTNDPGAFISEAAGQSHSSCFAKFKTTNFLTRIQQLGQRSEASVSSWLAGNLFLGDAAEFNLEQNVLNAYQDVEDFSAIPLIPNRWFNLDRHTTVTVKLRAGEPFYRVALLSSFVEPKAEVAEASVDLDAGVFLTPGETVIYKFLSDSEVAKDGAGRSHFALSLSLVGEKE